MQAGAASSEQRAASSKQQATRAQQCSNSSSGFQLRPAPSARQPRSPALLIRFLVSPKNIPRLLFHDACHSFCCTGSRHSWRCLLKPESRHNSSSSSIKFRHSSGNKCCSTCKCALSRQQLVLVFVVYSFTRRPDNAHHHDREDIRAQAKGSHSQEQPQ